jgi:hypothetical protein
MPKTSSMQVMEGPQRPMRGCSCDHAAADEHGMMASYAASTGLPQHDQRVRPTAPAPQKRPRQGRGDPRATAPDHRPGTSTGHNSTAVLPRRSGVPRSATPPTPHSDASSVPTAGTPGNSAALASGPPRAPPRGQISTQAPRTTADRALDPTPGTAPGTGKPHRGFEPAHASQRREDACTMETFIHQSRRS